MTQFSYKAIQMSGGSSATITGTREAPDERTLRDELRAGGLIVIDARPVRITDALRAQFAHSRPRRRDAVWFFQTLSVLMRGKVPIESALTTMRDLAPTPRQREVCDGVRDRLRSGELFADAVASVPGLAQTHHVALLRSAGEAGALDRAVQLIDESLSRAGELRRMLVGRLIYPAVLLCAALLVVWGLSALVIPKFAQQLTDLGGELPWPTRVTVGAADALVWAVPALVVGGAVLFGLRSRILTPGARRALSRAALRLPIVRDLVWRQQAALICDMLATMLSGGGDLLEGLSQARRVASSPEIGERLERAHAEVREGKNLGQALRAHDVLPPLELAMLQTGLESGDLVGGLRRATETSLQRQDELTQRLMTLFEPAVILVLFGLVAWVVYALVAGMISMNDLQGL